MRVRVGVRVRRLRGGKDKGDAWEQVRVRVRVRVRVKVANVVCVLV